jgi:F0F1-type ATP synthase assembly protein I
MSTTPTPPARPDDTLGAGIESGFVLVIFAGGGFLLDRWLATAPWFTIGLLVLGAVGIFFRLRAAYDEQMETHARDRRASAGERKATP